MRYMIVDDNARMRSVLRFLLRENVNEVLECSSGEEALERYDAFHPDAVLMDVELKGMDGFETLRKLKKRDPGARVLIVTNYDSPLFRERAEQEGAIAFISKKNLVDLEMVMEGLSR